MRVLLRVLAVLLPLALFCLWVMSLEGEYAAAEGGRDIIVVVLKALGALALLVILLAVMLRRWLLPLFGQKVSDALYAGTYLPGEDPLVVLVGRIASSSDASLLPELEALIKSDAGRLRGWQELARLQLEVFRDARASRDALLQGVECVRDSQDKALLLYRAAKLSESQLHDEGAARRFYEQAAARFPKTVYGKLSAQCLKP